MAKVFDSCRKDFSPYGFSCDRWQYAPMARADRHNEIEINLLNDGELWYILGGRRETVRSGALSMFWAATPHQVKGYSGTQSYIVATIPLAWFLQWKLPDSFVQQVLSGRMVHDYDAKRATTDLQLFAQWIEDLQDPSPEVLKTVQLEMEARLRRFAGTCCAHGDKLEPSLRGHRSEELTKIERVAAYITQNYTDPLTLADIGAHVGLHPNYTAQLFQKAFGITINAYIIEYRLSHAQRLLITTDTKVVDVALASGFNTLSRFNEAFKNACGCTPREYRRKSLVREVGI
jgi:AraC-like DNA-binding protein